MIASALASKDGIIGYDTGKVRHAVIGLRNDVV